MKTRISLFFCLFTCLVVSAQTQPNIIFVMIDDLNDFVEGFGGHPQTITPNIAELESKGTTFVNSYCTAPQCGPSRLSLLSGKDLAYTQVYDNSEYICNAFSDHFKPAYGNAEYFTLPGYLKDSAGYFTLGLNKIFHCYDDFPEYDSVTSDPCAKNLSWNKVLYHSDSAATVPLTLLYDDGLAPFRWGKFDSLEEPLLMDYVITDSAINWLNAYAADPSIACDKPFFMGIGYRKPHFPSFVPEQYFSPYYLEDFYGTDFDIPYNYPEGSTPYNGIILNQ
ncbi:MAG: sulfatase-like hydrolase/transferase, partial [Chitinophagales bacterium]